ncbi:MAG: hypothetical protein GOVbin406_7 [Prokaryotic dsDNA virus sp.]|nr:MAG: hypothetical protein GOVbin406_7 [Prokaryotic dsDNA virus sp.]|tara:strand:- start:18372 stop:18662 length:291 start_codon:yes stop_codon:yes gene_type:complete
MIKALENVLNKGKNVKTVFSSGYIDAKNNVLFSKVDLEKKRTKSETIKKAKGAYWKKSAVFSKGENFVEFIQEIKDSKFQGQDVKYVWFTRYEVAS